MTTSSASPQRSPLWVILLGVVLVVLAIGAYYVGRDAGEKKYHHISGFAWDAEQWAQRTKGIRTSYNPNSDLNSETLTLVPGDERWLDFVFWCFNNKVAEHQVEAYGGTDFNSTVVRLKVNATYLLRHVDFISIPLWCD